MAENRYQQGKIYKIISPNTDRIYIGSTTERLLARRMRNHRVEYRLWKNGATNYLSSFSLFEAGDESIILLEAFPCNSKDELRAREQHHIELNAAICVNKRRAIGQKERPPEFYLARAAKHSCPCGGRFVMSARSTHYKSNMHQRYAAANQAADPAPLEA